MASVPETSDISELSLKWIEIPALFDDLKAEFKDFAAQARVHIAFFTQPDLDGMEADSDVVREIFLHLIRNAIQYNSARGDVIINLYKSPDLQWVVCEVKDTGSGIPKDKLQKMFFTPNLVTQDGAKVPGLVLTKQLVERHGGVISIESTPKQGTTVTFRLPVRLSRTAPKA